MKALINAIDYIQEKNIDGSFVECGVWKGGCIMAMMERLKFHKMNRMIWAYDTFSEGMLGACEKDISVKGHIGSDLNGQLSTKRETFEKNISKIDYDINKVIIIEGDARQTIVENKPEQIALLRLDMDFYEATKIALHELYPLVSNGGIILFDDYNWWNGAKKAVDEYIDSLGTKPRVISNDNHWIIK